MTAERWGAKAAKRGWPLALLLGALFGSGCVGDAGSLEEVAKTEQALSHTGPWDIPAETIAIGDTQHVNYTGAGPWVGPSGCGGGMRPGTAVFRDWLRSAFPQISLIGGYSCRSINGDSSTMSVHGTGRALDIHIPLHAGAADNDLGDPIGNWLIEHAEQIGIQYIIWDRWTWGAHRRAGEKERAYGGAHPHHDHLHVELSVEAGEGRTPWFTGPMDMPGTSACPDLGVDGGLIEEAGPCFTAYGPATYWRRESGAGHGGSLMWTNAFESGSPSNWGRWQIRPAMAGDYELSIFVDPAFGVHRSARYALTHGGETHEITVDLSAASGWIALGEFRFEAGEGQHLSVYDNASGPVASDQHIPADAIRLTPVGAEPPMTEPTEPTEPGEPGEPPASEPESPVVTVSELPADPGPGLDPTGDPRLDDDPYYVPGDAPVLLTSGCSAHPGAPSSPLSLALLLPLLALALRGGARRRRRP